MNPTVKKVVIYSTPNCTYCNMTKEFFAANNIPYETIDVAADPVRRQEMIDKSGQMGVPVIFIDDQMIIGYNKRVLSNLLGIQT
ncbi:MAG TPA: glutaredoxin domain-containing protein [Candidatus Paceibacterota bacterium]